MLANVVRTLMVGAARSDGCQEAMMPDPRLYLVIGTDAAPTGPAGFVPTCVSGSGTTGLRGLVATSSGRIGLDLETYARIACNATVHDRWLSEPERRHIEHSSNPLLELACCWVLREAYGKALGVGLALPLDRLVFAVRNGVIRLTGAAARPASSWMFALYRHTGAVMATAWDPAGQPMPFAPAGRKPPTPPLDR